MPLRVRRFVRCRAAGGGGKRRVHENHGRLHAVRQHVVELLGIHVVNAVKTHFVQDGKAALRELVNIHLRSPCFRERRNAADTGGRLQNGVLRRNACAPCCEIGYCGRRGKLLIGNLFVRALRLRRQHIKHVLKLTQRVARRRNAAVHVLRGMKQILVDGQLHRVVCVLRRISALRLRAVESLVRLLKQPC